MNHTAVSRILTEDVSSLADSRHYNSFLRLLGRLHAARPANIILVYFQKPDAVMVAGYHIWNDKYGRQVKKGEKAITILRGKFTAGEDCRTLPVFDLSQTAGREIPPERLPPSLSTPEEYRLLQRAAVLASFRPVRFDHLPPAADGFYRPIHKDIILQRDMPDICSIRALFRENARAILYEKNPDRSAEYSLRRSREAESTACAVCGYYGIPGYERSLIPPETGSVQELTASLERIRSVCSSLINAVESVRFPPGGEKRDSLVFSLRNP